MRRRVVCTACPFHCRTCVDSQKNDVMICKTCDYQYVLNAGDCGACPQYCLRCTESNDGLTCTQCKNRTVMITDGTCQRKYTTDTDRCFLTFYDTIQYAWNSLPCHVRDMPSLLAFRRELKTVLFRLSYPVD